MTLVTGARLGQYEVLGPLGAGGMGEVYRARDTKLNREVALKVLPDSLAADPDRLARFRREAQVLASLNHPNIAHLYGFDDASSTHALVMELVEGPTLADRIAQKPIPIADAILIAKQIADALEAAHEQGIVHRDLKPANIKVRDDGTVKVLDFGLAKAFASAPGSEAAVGPANLSTVMNSTLTERGVILGTAAYMSPEQAVGKPVDKRSDLWAFGVVLFEMLTARRVFAGPDLAHVLAAVLKSEPDWTLLPADTPMAVRRLLRRCLEKDRRRRIADAADARLELDDAGAPADRDGAFVPAPTAAAPVSTWRRALPWAAAAGGIGAAVWVLALWAPWRVSSVREPRSLLSSIGAEGWTLASVGPAAILSPDGKTLAFVAGMGKGSRLFVRKLELLDAVPIALTDDADSPFFSPDGQWIGFFADGKLKKVSVNGGAVIPLCDASGGRGGTWLDDNTIVFSPTNLYKNNLLLRVSSTGGTPTVFGAFSSPGATTQRWPQALPDGKGVLYTENVGGVSTESANLVIAPLSGGAPRIIGTGYYGRYVPSGVVSSKPGEHRDGHLIYVQNNILFAVPFDLDRQLKTGPVVNALIGMAVTVGSASAQLAFSSEGTLVYLPSTPLRINPIDWLARDGKTSQLRAKLTDWATPRFSPDGKKLAIAISDGKQRDLWVEEWEPTEHQTQLTANVGENRAPVWIDNEHIVFSSDREKTGRFNLYLANANATGDVTRLTNNAYNEHSASSYGKLLAYTRSGGGQQNALMVVPIERDAEGRWKTGTETVFLSLPDSMGDPEFSPDGHWIAYSSTESGEVGHGVGGGRYDIWVRPYPVAGGRSRVSQGGGKNPRWSIPAHELLFVSGDLSELSVARYDTAGNAFHAYPAEQWSSTTLLTMGPGYDLNNRDGRIAGVIAPDPSSLVRDQVVFVSNFFDHLRKIAPVKK